MPTNRFRLTAAVAASSFVAIVTGLVSTAPEAAATTGSVYRVTAGKTAVTDSAGQSWQPDATYVQGGSLSTSKNTVANTATPALYRQQRTGDSSYEFPVSATGTYGVVIDVAELGNKSPGQRVYDVLAEGATVASRVDVAANAGKNTAWHLVFSVPVSDGALDLDVRHITGQPAIGAIAIDDVRPDLAPAVTFDDEFNGVAGSAPDAANWSQDMFPGNNNQLQYWTDHDATADGNGSMVISARKESFTGGDGVTRAYTSARLTTAGHYTWFYGEAEARIFVPAGQGLWPSFWSVGQKGPWPSNGEIDGMEMKGQEPKIDHGAVHGLNTNYSEWTYHATTTSTTPLAGQWHTYAMLWQPGVVETLVDGRPFMAVTPADVSGADIWPFDSQPFILRMQLAVGGDFVGAPSRSTVFPANMLVDWVRVTQ
jgi:hypothetical protein